MEPKSKQKKEHNGEKRGKGKKGPPGVGKKHVVQWLHGNHNPPQKENIQKKDFREEGVGGIAIPKPADLAEKEKKNNPDPGLGAACGGGKSSMRSESQKNVEERPGKKGGAEE